LELRFKHKDERRIMKYDYTILEKNYMFWEKGGKGFEGLEELKKVGRVGNV
jgi:hypothetical protein